MTPDEYYDFAERMCHRGLALSRKKNQDYADPGARQADPFAVFANFTACERCGVCTTEQGFVVRMLDKLVRVSNLTRPGHEQGVKDEAVQDTLDDLHNYAELFAGFLECVRRYGRPVLETQEGPEDGEPQPLDEELLKFIEGCGDPDPDKPGAVVELPDGRVFYRTELGWWERPPQPTQEEVDKAFGNRPGRQLLITDEFRCPKQGAGMGIDGKPREWFWDENALRVFYNTDDSHRPHWILKKVST